MPWPKGKPRPDEDKEKISRGKRGIPDEPDVRRSKSEGQKRRREREKEEKEKEKK